MVMVQHHSKYYLQKHLVRIVPQLYLELAHVPVRLACSQTRDTFPMLGQNWGKTGAKTTADSVELNKITTSRWKKLQGHRVEVPRS